MAIVEYACTKESQMDFVQALTEAVADSIGPEGIGPHPCYYRKGESVTLAALDLDGRSALSVIKDLVSSGVDELIVGLDIYTKEGQGTEFADAVIVNWYVKDRDVPWRIGVINYQAEPRIVRDIDWDNTFWPPIWLDALGAGG